MSAGLVGQIVAPGGGSLPLAGVDWCADNGAFTGAYPGKDGYLVWLADRAEFVDRCMFAVAPDIVCDAAGTIARSAPMLPRIRALGYRAGLVAQNGLEHLAVPWESFDALFIGGDTAWKLGPAARALIAEARSRGKHVHMGRVNSLRRLRYAQAVGCDSADGTFLTFGPDANLPKLLGWLRAVAEPPLFDLTEVSA